MENYQNYSKLVKETDLSGLYKMACLDWVGSDNDNKNNNNGNNTGTEWTSRIKHDQTGSNRYQMDLTSTNRPIGTNMVIDSEKQTEQLSSRLPF